MPTSHAIHNRYSCSDIKKLLENNLIYSSNKLFPHLVEVFSTLPKNIVNRCIEEVDFLEMDRWGETYISNDFQIKFQKVTIQISQETLDLSPRLSKFIFLHEIGHLIKNHSNPMSNREVRECQDKEADGFASLYFPEWKQYFIRDKENNLRLIKHGKQPGYRAKKSK